MGTSSGWPITCSGAVVGAFGNVDAGGDGVAELAAAVADEQLAAVERRVEQHGAADAVVGGGGEAEVGGGGHLIGKGVAITVVGPGEFPIRYMLSRLRSTAAGLRLRMRLATNPGNVGHAMHKAAFHGQTCTH